MNLEPSSESVYEHLSKDGAPKFIKALDQIKVACDHIETAKGAMTYSQVGAVATKLFGGPKAQSIQNSYKHKQYIDARQQEYRQQHSPKSNQGSQNLRGLIKYPSEGLDYRTRRYIDDLRQRNSMLEAAMREFKTTITMSTMEAPIDFNKMLTGGPDDEGSMSLSIIPKEFSQLLSEPAKAGLHTLLVLMPTLVSEVELFRGKSLRLRSGDWLLPPDQYAALRKMLDA